VVADGRLLEDELIGESTADAQNLVNRCVAHASQQRIKHIKSSVVKTKNYQHYQENGIKRVLQDPVSTFSIDVDTGSYTNIRRMTHRGMLPPADAIRIEKLVNYFDYDHSQQSENNSGTPFSIHTSIASSPWTEQRHIMAIGIKRLESRC